MNNEFGIENGELKRLRAKLAVLRDDERRLEGQLIATRGAVQVVEQLLEEALRADTEDAG